MRSLPMAMSGIMNFLSIAVKDRDLERNALSLLSIFLCRDFSIHSSEIESLLSFLLFFEVYREEGLI